MNYLTQSRGIKMMDYDLISLFPRLKDYLELSGELKTHLARHPDDWREFREEFNTIVYGLSQDIIQLEKNDKSKCAVDVNSKKKLFETNYRGRFIFGEYIKWALEKPFGYAGDFKIIEDIYRNNPRTTGFERLFDNQFTESICAGAVRERKEDFKRIILNFARDRKRRRLHIMSLASGPAREIRELLQSNSHPFLNNTVFHCYDFDANAINYARRMLNNVKNVEFFQENAIRLALRNSIEADIPYRYDLIYSTGLFDYFNERIATRLLRNLAKLLNPGGVIVISNMWEKKYNAASAGAMEWIMDWDLVYRTRDEFERLFTGAGFQPGSLKMAVQGSKVMQYCFAYNN